MAQVIDVPGVGEVEFPDNMSDDDIVAAIKKQQAPPAQTETTPESKLGPWSSAVVRPLAKGVAALPVMAMDTGVALRNIAEQGTRKYAPTLAKTIDKITGGGPGAPYELPSEMFNRALDTYTTAPEGIGKGAEFVSSALVGAKAVPNPQAAAQAPAGFVKPPPSPSAPVAERGLPLTLGRRLGATGRTLEDIAANVPIIGGAIRARQQEALAAWNKSLLQQIDKSVTEHGPEGFKQASSALSAAYKKIWGAEMPFNRNGLRQAWAGVVQNATAKLPKEAADDVAKQLRHQFSQILSGARQGGTQGATLEAVDDALREAAKKAAKNGDGAIASTFNQARTAFREQMDPAVNAALRSTDELYMKLSTLRNAAKRSGADTFSPGQLLAAARKKGGETAMAEMRAPFQQEAINAADVLGVARSTPVAAAERAANTTLGRTMGALAVGGGAIADLGTTAGLLSLGRLAYTPTGQRILTEGLKPGEQTATARILAQTLAQMENQ